MSLELNNLEPYLDRESAAQWLRRELGDGTAISRKAMYHLNIVNHFLQNDTEILKRLPQARLGGLPEGGRRNVAAACILRASEGAGGTQCEDVRDSGFTVTQERVGHWAERDACWSDYADSAREDAGYRYLASGSEADVYLDSRGICHKNIDISHYGSLQGLMDRIAIHNAVFPEAAMTVEGFGLKDAAEFNDGFCVMVSQPFITGSLAPQETIIRHMEVAGFRLVGKEAMEVVQAEAAESGLRVPQFSIFFRFVSDDGIHVHDLNDQNVVLSPKGNLMVYDCDMSLNRDRGLGPVHAIPEVTFAEGAVARIDEFLEKLVPLEMDRLDFEMLYGTRDNRLHEQLNGMGRYDGMIDVRGVGLCLVMVNPSDRERVLLLPHENARLMSRLTGDYDMNAEQRVWMAQGHAVRLNARTTVVFDLDKGRPVKIHQQRKFLSPMEKVKEQAVREEPVKNMLKR